MEIMVCGFAFNPEQKNVLLIRKKRPEWQKGKLNGIGGHIKRYEGPKQAMVREFKEECGIETETSYWAHFATLSNPMNAWSVYFFRTTFYIKLAKSKTDEKIKIVHICDLWKENVIPNLRWLIPLAMEGSTEPVFVLYR